MRSTFPILICCLYALSAVDATVFSKRGNAEVQQGNAKAAKPLNFWSDDKSDDKDDKWNKDDDDDHYGDNGQNDCASRSVSVLIGSSTYAIPCLQDRSIVNLNGLIPTPLVISSTASSLATEASSSAVDSSSSAASSSEESSSTDTTTTATITFEPQPG